MMTIDQSHCKKVEIAPLGKGSLQRRSENLLRESGLCIVKATKVNHKHSWPGADHDNCYVPPSPGDQ